MKARLTRITAKYDGYCGECRKPVARGGPAVYDWARKATLCAACGEHKMKQTELFQ